MSIEAKDLRIGNWVNCISKFEKLSYTECDAPNHHEQPDIVDEFETPITECAEAKYHLSWDWQAPVWGKFCKLVSDDLLEIPSDKRWIYLYELAFRENKPNIGFDILVETIKWYNSLNKTVKTTK